MTKVMKQIYYSGLNVVFLSLMISAEKYCTLSASQLKCNYDMGENRSLSVDKADITTLDLSGTILNELDRSSVKDYINVEELILSNCRIKSIKNGSFVDLPKLSKLNLTDNLLTSFNTDSLEDLPSLNVLILSNNLLSSFDKSTLVKIPKLKILDLSGNRLRYLHKDMISEFAYPFLTLVIDQNPWDCNDSHWRDALEEKKYLKDQFCRNSYEVNSTGFNGVKNNYTGRNISANNRTRKKQEGGFINCKWWIVGSIWIGVILGNVDRINKLLYQFRCRKKKISFAEKSVGTDDDPYLHLRQETLLCGLEEIGKRK